MNEYGTYRLYKFNGSLVSYQNRKHNINGWYHEKHEAFKDLQRCITIDSGQFVIICNTSQRIVGVASESNGVIYEIR